MAWAAVDKGGIVCPIMDIVRNAGGIKAEFVICKV